MPWPLPLPSPGTPRTRGDPAPRTGSRNPREPRRRPRTASHSELQPRAPQPAAHHLVRAGTPGERALNGPALGECHLDVGALGDVAGAALIDRRSVDLGQL